MKKIQSIFKDYKHHSIKEENGIICVRFNDITTMKMGEMLLDVEGIKYTINEGLANIYINP